MGRPRETNAREKHLTLRLTLDELITVHEAARRAGQSLSDFARERILKEKKRAKPKVTLLAGLDPELWMQVRKVGVNLNQIAHRLNSAERPALPPDLPPLLAHIRALLRLPMAGP